MATPTPPPVMPMSDPEERIYRSDDFRVSDPDVVRPTPMYCGDKLSAVTFTMLPGQIHEAHMHTDMTQAWIILEGTGEAILGNGRRDVVGPGTMIVHHPTQMHGIVNIGETNLVYINVSERPPERLMAATSEERELITRVTGKAPAAQMMRRYWLPALWSEEIAEADGTPVRVRMFGENLVAFRDTTGTVGLLAEACPHRLASLALGRNEDGGLRCIYHGWKFGADGACLDMPTEPGEHGFRNRMRATSYPVREAGGIVWAYLGPAGEEPAFPHYDWTSVPRSHVAHLKFVENANYLQAVEGAIDSAHTRFLHRGTLDPHEEATRNALSLDLAPRLEAVDTSYGFRYVAIRKPNVDADTFKYAKSTRFVMPTTAITSKPMEADHPALTQIFVPMDDEHTMHFTIWHATNGRPLDERELRRYYKLEPGVDLDSRFRPKSNIENWWNQDRTIMSNGDWSGIAGLMTQDAACQESMGPIADRSAEHLGTSDVAIIRMRRRMLENVRRFVEGRTPIGLEGPIAYERLHSVPQVKIPIDEPWQNVDSYDGEFTAEPARVR